MSTYSPVTVDTTWDEIIEEAELMVRDILQAESLTDREKEIVAIAAETGIRQATERVRKRVCAAI